MSLVVVGLGGLSISVLDSGSLLLSAVNEDLYRWLDHDFRLLAIRHRLDWHNLDRALVALVSDLSAAAPTVTTSIFSIFSWRLDVKIWARPLLLVSLLL